MIYLLMHYLYGTSGLIRGSVRLAPDFVIPWHIFQWVNNGGRKFDKKD